MSNENYHTMTNYIDGLRIKKWKPNKNDPNFEILNDNNDFCFLYNDESNNTQDSILNGSTCSKDNPLFQSSLINRVFQTNHPDKSHLLPIDKCVFEIDKTKANDVEIINAFWNEWQKMDCTTITEDRRKDLRQKKEKENSLQSDLHNKREQLNLKKMLINEQDHFLYLCNASYEDIIRELQKTQEVYDLTVQENENLLSIIGTLEININNLETNVQILNEQIQENTNAYESLLDSYQECEKSKDSCQREKKDILSTIRYIENENDRLNKEINETIKKTNRMQEQYEILKNNFENCKERKNALKEKLNDFVKKYGNFYFKNEKCQEELDKYRASYIKDKKEKDLIERSFLSCEDEKKVLEDKFYQCQNKVDRCINNINNETEKDDDFNLQVEDKVNLQEVNENYFVPINNEIDSMKDTIQNKKIIHNNCMIEKTKLRKNIEELQKRSKILEKQIEKNNEYQIQMKNDSYKTVSDNVRDVYNSQREKYIKIFNDQMEENVENQCTLDISELNFEYEQESIENKRLTSKINQISKNEFDRECKEDCEINIAQCLIHKNNKDICDSQINMSTQAFEQSKNMYMIKIEIFDQTDDKTHEIVFRERKDEFIRKSDPSDLQYFNIEVPEPLQGEFSFTAYGGDNVACMNNNENKDENIIQQDSIELQSRTRKFRLGPDVTCLKLSLK